MLFLVFEAFVYSLTSIMNPHKQNPKSVMKKFSNLILFLAIIVVSSESYAQGERLTAHLVQSGVLGSSCAKKHYD